MGIAVGVSDNLTNKFDAVKFVKSITADMEEDRISTALREMLTQMYYKSGKRSTVMIDGIDCLY